MEPPARNINIAWMIAVIFSALPCPKGCSSSAGFEAKRIARKVMLTANRSKKLSTACARTLKLPVTATTTALSTIRLMTTIRESLVAPRIPENINYLLSGFDLCWFGTPGTPDKPVPFVFIPYHQKSGGYEDGVESAGDNADEQNNRKVLYRSEERRV